MHRIFARLFGLGCLLVSASAFAEDRNVLVYLDDDSKFEVLYSRAKSTATGLVLFGLIGYGIEESDRNNDDNRREEAMLEHLADPDCATDFAESMTGLLEDRGIAYRLAESNKEKASGFTHTLHVRLHTCGFMLTNQADEELSAFYAVSYAITSVGEKKQKMAEVLITGPRRATWDVIMTEPGLAVEEFYQTRIRAGRRVANKFVYLR